MFFRGLRARILVACLPGLWLRGVFGIIVLLFVDSNELGGDLSESKVNSAKVCRSRTFRPKLCILVESLLSDMILNECCNKS